MTAERQSRASVALAVLTLSNLLSFINRNVVFALFEPIKRELLLTDAQLGWLASGYVFMFSLAALPFGVLGDLRSRRLVLTAGIVIWSIAAIGGGLAQSFTALLVARALGGLGGAAFGATAQPLVADYYPTRGRALAMGILTAGITLGGVLGIWLGGKLELHYGWRWTMVLVGAPGFLLAAVTARLHDPAQPDYVLTLRAVLRDLGLGTTAFLRRFTPALVGLVIGSSVAYVLTHLPHPHPRLASMAFGVSLIAGIALNVWSWVREFARMPALLVGERRGGFHGAVLELVGALALVLRTPTLVYVFVGGALISFGINGLVGWAPTFMSRELGLSVRAAAALLGTWGLLAGIAGAVTGGLLADALRKVTPSGRVLTIALGLLIGGPLAIWLLTVRDMAVFVPVFAAAFFFISWYNGPIAAAIFDVVPMRISATVAGAYLLFIHLVGDTVAFPLIGALSDRFGIDRAVLLLPIVALVGGVVVLLAVRTVARDMERKRELDAVGEPAAA